MGGIAILEQLFPVTVDHIQYCVKEANIRPNNFSTSLHNGQLAPESAIAWKGQLSITVSRGETCADVVILTNEIKHKELLQIFLWPKKLILQPYRADPKDVIHQAQLFNYPSLIFRMDGSRDAGNFDSLYQLLCRSGVCASALLDETHGLVLFPSKDISLLAVAFIQIPLPLFIKNSQ